VWYFVAYYVKWSIFHETSRTRLYANSTTYTHTHTHTHTHTEQSSFETLGGTFGWRSPEQILGQRSTKSVDLFAVGCILFFSCTLGAHPFGARASREANILSARPDLSKLKEDPTACHLIRALLHNDPCARPQAAEARQHPFFWSAMLQLDLLLDVSDRLESILPDSPLVQDLEARSTVVFGVAGRDGVEGNGRSGPSGSDAAGTERGAGAPTWDRTLSKDLVVDLSTGGAGRRKYKFDSFRDLLRAVRNKKNHFLDLPPLLQVVMGPLPDGSLHGHTPHSCCLSFKTRLRCGACAVIESGCLFLYTVFMLMSFNICAPVSLPLTHVRACTAYLSPLALPISSTQGTSSTGQVGFLYY